MRLFFTSLSVLLLSMSFNVSAQVICQTSDDPDGDGWGYENNNSCRMPTGGSTNTNTNTGNNNSVTLSTLLGQCITELAAQENNSGSNSGAGDPNCVDTAPVGDGWGWNGVGSCRVGATSNQAQQCTTNNNNTGNNNGSQGGQYGTGFTDYTNQVPTCQEAGDRILRLVRVGMHESEVLRLVGKPRHVSGSSGSDIYWGYNSRSGTYRTPRIQFRFDDRRVISFSASSTCS